MPSFCGSEKTEGDLEGLLREEREALGLKVSSSPLRGRP